MAFPASASAHGIQLVTNLPIPAWLFAWGASAVLIVSFVALATLWPTPKLVPLRERVWFHYPGWLDPLCGLVGVAMFALVVYAGLLGAQLPTANIAPTWIFVIFWVGLAFASVLVGDVFRPFNPWRAIARASSWIMARARRGQPASEPLPYPARVGRWPAVVGILGFAWLELCCDPAQRTEPKLLAFLSLAYAAVQLVGMSLYGIETWTDRADGFGVYFSFFALMAPLHWANGEVRVRKPFAGAVALDVLPGTIAVIVAMIGSTSFDGFSNGTAWLFGIYPALQSLFTGLGVSVDSAPELIYTVGLLGSVGVVGGLYWVGALGIRSLGGRYRPVVLAQRFAHTLLPISIAYLVAHYFSLLLFSGQYMVPLVSDPLGNGANIFGTANASQSTTIVSANTIWYVQVGALLVGHVGGLTLAHDRGLTLFRGARDAARSQYWMLTVMVAFTCLGLWILSSTQ